MKKDRNCNMSVYPGIMPAFGGMMYPGQMGGVPANMAYQDNYSDYGNLNNKVNSLEQRVTRLENMMNGTNYNSNNYQMM